jgi:hypothetical protein
MPKTPCKFEISVNAELLQQIAKYVSQFKADDTVPALRMQFWDKNRAIRFDAENKETGQGFTGLLMPLRDDGPYKACYPTVQEPEPMPEAAKQVMAVTESEPIAA